MSEHTDVKTLNCDETTPFRIQKIKVGNKSLITPLKAIDLTKITANDWLYQKPGITEVYKEIKKEQINNINSSSEYAKRFEQQLNTPFNKVGTDDLSFLFLKYADKGMPSTKEIECLTDTAYSYSDITPIPATTTYPNEINSTELEKYKNYLKESIEIIKQWNKKPIMGILPSGLPRDYITDEIIPFYLNEGINSFYLDFEGKTIQHLQIRPILRKLSSEKILENTFLYSLNTNIGRIKKDANAITAKDFLNFGYGFDSVGEQHARIKRPKEFYTNLKNIKHDKVRLFNRSDYGYYRLDKKQEINAIYPTDACFTLDNLLKNKSKNQKVFNMAEQYKETLKLKEVTNEDTQKGFPDYILSKQYAERELKKMTLTKRGV